MFAVKKISVIGFICIYIMSGCAWFNVQEDSSEESGDQLPGWTEDLSQTEVYGDDPVTVITGESGTASVQSQNLGVTYEIAIEKDGQIIDGYVVEYTENGNLSVLHGYDPLGRYSSFVISGTPDYLHEYFSDVEIQSRVLIVGTIALLIAVTSIAVAEVSFILEAAKIQEFYYQNAVDYYDGGLVLKTTYEELATDFIGPRISGVFCLVDIGFTFITAGFSDYGKATLYTLQVDMLENNYIDAINDIRDELLSLAVEEYGITMQEAVDSEIYVVVDLDEEDNGFEKMYASYKIYLENPTADVIFQDSFETCYIGEDPSYQYWDVIESGSSDISAIMSDSTDGDMSIEFNDGISDDYCYMVGDLGSLSKGWISWDWKVKNPGSFGFQAWSGNASYSWDYVNFYVSFNSLGSLFYNYSHSTLEEAIFEYEEDKWYSMKLYFDCTTDTIDLYVNGVKRLRQHSFWHNTSGIEHFRFIAFSNASIQGAVIDNVKVTAASGETEPSVAASISRSIELIDNNTEGVLTDR